MSLSSSNFDTDQAAGGVLARMWIRLETWIIGPLAPDVRRNMRADLVAAMVFGVFLPGLNFIPVILRRMGASPGWIAFYLSQVFIGFMLNSISVRFLPADHRLIRTGTVIWTIGRGLFVLAAFITQVEWLIFLTFAFWLFESLPIPLYTRLMQLIYPDKVRARAMSFVRVGVALVTLAVTPVAGWILDHLGPQVLLPISGVMGALSGLLFLRMRLTPPDQPMESRPTVPTSPLHLLEILKQDARFSIYLVALALFGIGYLALTPLFPLVTVDRLELSYFTIGWLGIVQSIFFLLGYMFLGRLIDARGGVLALRLIFLTGVVVAVSFLAATNEWILVPAYAALGLLGAGLDIGTLNTVIQLAGQNRVSDYAALQTTVMGIRGLVAPFIGVFLVNAGMPVNLVFAVGAGIMFLSAIVLLAPALRKPA